MSKNIVYIDDDQDDLDLFREAMEETCPNVKLTTKTNADELFIITENGNLPDMIVLDINMPRLNGFDCLQKVRATPHLQTVPVVMLSTSNFVTQREAAKDLGANFFFKKAASIAEVHKLVHDICNLPENANWE